MCRAEALRKICDDPKMSEYWSGYIRGLRRAYHGKKFGTGADHKMWLAAATSDDEFRKQIGLGYRDGIAFDAISSHMGRPPISDETTKSIGVRLPESIVARIPEPHSEWIRNLIIANLPK